MLRMLGLHYLPRSADAVSIGRFRRSPGPGGAGPPTWAARPGRPTTRETRPGPTTMETRPGATRPGEHDRGHPAPGRANPLARPRQESNLHPALRRRVLYPLSYEGRGPRERIG